MTDKVQKIREEVERMHNLLPVMDGDNISINYADRICTTLEMYIDSLQEEPVSEDLEAAANEWDAKASFTPFYITLDDKGNPYEVKQDYTTHAESFKAGAKWQEKKDQDAVEIAREEIYEWLEEHSQEYVYWMDEEFGKEDLINDLKQAMEDE